jgi:hypothetical protein
MSITQLGAENAGAFRRQSSLTRSDCPLNWFLPVVVVGLALRAKEPAFAMGCSSTFQTAPPLLASTAHAFCAPQQRHQNPLPIGERLGCQPLLG